MIAGAMVSPTAIPGSTLEIDITQSPNNLGVAYGLSLLLVLPPESCTPGRGVNLGGAQTMCRQPMGDSALAKAELMQTPALSTPVSPGDP